jgi:hypothetical protein
MNNKPKILTIIQLSPSDHGKINMQSYIYISKKLNNKFNINYIT